MSDLDELLLNEISSLHASLLLECEDYEPVSVVQSAPSTPVTVRQGAFDLFRSRSLQSSPPNLGLVVKTSSVKDLINLFDLPNSSNMAEKAKSEAANYLSKISHAKKWISRSLSNLENALLIAGENKIDPLVYKTNSDQFQAQYGKIITHQIAIEDIYTKHKVAALFEPINNDIEKYLKDKQDELNVFAARVDKPALGVFPPGKQVTKADLLTVMSHMGQEQIKVNIDCPKFKGD